MALTKAHNRMIAGSYVNVLDYGAVGDGVADDTAAIQAAIDYSASVGARCLAPFGTYLISSKLIIKCDIDFSQATINAPGTLPVAIEISTGSSANPTDRLQDRLIFMPKLLLNTTKPSTGWAGQGVGVRCVNTYSNTVFFGEIRDFATGVLFTSFGTNGCVYNSFHIGHCRNNQIGLDLRAGEDASWVNENNFFGGRLSIATAEGSNISGTRQIRISKPLTTAGNVNNNNRFYGLSLEGDGPEYHLENGGRGNLFLACRWEATTPKVLYTADINGQAEDNQIIGGVFAPLIVFTYDNPSGGGRYNTLDSSRKAYWNVTGTEGRAFKNAGSSTDPVHTYYEAAVEIENASASEWSVKHFASGLIAKRSTDAEPRLQVDYQNGRIYFGEGITALASLPFLRKTGATQIGSNDDFRVGGDLAVVGALSKGSGSFKIDHPLKPDTHYLVHSFLEGPNADLIYRGTVALKDGLATVNLDAAAGMTAGTFDALCRNVQCYTTNEFGWTSVRGSVSNGVLTVESQSPCDDLVSWLVIGERKDRHMVETSWTDESGKVIVEPEKELDVDLSSGAA